MVSQIIPNLWCDGNAAEVAEFYTKLFPASRILETINYPKEGLLEFQQHLAGQPVTVDFELRDLRFTAINAGPEFRANPSISFMVNFDPSLEPDARELLDELWAGLLDGGTVLMPLDAYPFSKHYGWVQDRFGFSWQLILTDPDGDPRPTIIPCLLFGGANQNRAKDALEFYTGALPVTETGTVAPYGEPTGPATSEALMFAEFRLWNQWIVAMDSGVEQDFTFNEAVSFGIECENQREIDEVWAILSRVPEAEQCCWCKDQFGVSWQVMPQNVGRLLARPHAFEHMMQMKKLVIADY